MVWGIGTLSGSPVFENRLVIVVTKLFGVLGVEGGVNHDFSAVLAEIGQKENSCVVPKLILVDRSRPKPRYKEET